MSSKILTLQDSLVSLENTLEDFVYAQQGPASIKIPKKRSQIGYYAVCNKPFSHRDSVIGIDYTGLTAYDIENAMRYSDPSITTNAVDADSKIFNGLPYIQYKQSIPIAKGLYSVEQVTKRPIFSKDNKIIGLIGYAQDITSYLNPLYLFSQYQKQYPIKKAIRHLLHHLRIQHFFYVLPTQRELETLLIMRESNATKYATKAMKLSPKAIEEHKARLRSNLKLVTLNDLVTKLRVRDEFKDVYASC